MNRHLLVTFLFALLLFPARADVFISEFLANNETGLVDEDGDHSDWIEIHNNGAAAVNLQNWRLTDDSGDLGKWVFPSVDLAPNGFLIVFASNKDRTNPAQSLHTNFKLSASGGYLALVKPDLSFASEFNPYPAHYADKPYGYSQTVSTTTFVGSTGALKWLVPTNNTLGLTWTARTFADGSWGSGTNAAGFETTVAGWQVRTVFANTGNVSSAAVAETILATPSQQASSTTVNHPIIDWTNSGANGHYSPDNPPPALNTAADLDFYVVEGTGIVTISTPGVWSFCISSDDGCTLQIRPLGAGGYTSVITDPGLRGMNDSIGTYNFASAGDYEIRAVIYENGGGSGGEVSARSGSVGSWDASFKRIGDTASGGLAIRSNPPGGSGSGGYGSLIGTNLLASMYNSSPKRSSVFLRYPFTVANPATVSTLTLLMQYDDGFVAYLNGQEIGRRNVAAGTLNFDAIASGDRPNASALLAETLDATSLKGQLVAGTNVLAIHGLNSAAADGDLLLRPQLAQYVGTTGALAYFNTATPGSFNTATVYNRVAPIAVSVPHGFYTTPQSVQLTCATPGATIYYTYDGSVPSATNPASASGASPVNLTISGTRVLRAVGVKAGSDNSDLLAQTYIFLADVITQSSGGAPPTIVNPPGATQATTAWPTGPINGQVLDYGMDPDVVNNPAYSGTILNDLKSIPTISVVTDKNNLFHPSYGIYVNPGQDGDSADPNYPDPISPPQNWERRASIELINPDGTPGFQANCGLRLRGGFSRSTDNPKHALRFFFRDEYGVGKLKYDLHRTAPFGTGGAQEFNKFDLRCAQNYSWSFQGDGGNGVFVRDVVARDMQLAMGQPSSRGAYFHLYLNGQYWGIYNVDERPEANFGESYFGGVADDYDVVKIDPDNGYNLEATDGNTTAWAAYWTLADQTLPNAGTESARNAVYQQMKGNNANGTPNPAFPVYLDDVGLIDQMLVVYYGGNLDAPISNFLGNTSGNNVYTLRNRNGVSGGWKGILHDSEHTLLNVNENRTGPWTAGSSTVQGLSQGLSKSTQQYIFQQLVANSSDFRILFADRTYKHMANGGVLTPAGVLSIFNGRTTEIDRAVVAESARWGDSKSGTPFTRDGNWLPAANNIRNNYIPFRTAVVLGQYRTQGWYPSFDPPVWSIRGGTVPPGTNVTLSLPVGAPGGSAVYYTLDGSDPRALGGGISPSAIQYSGPISISVSRFIRTRVKSATDWSAIDEAAFYTTQNFTGLSVTEINYRPLPTTVGGIDEDDYEFIEFKNTSASTIDMGGVNFTTGITYTFPAGTTIAPGQFFLLVRNLAKFTSRYPAVSMAPGTFGEYASGRLDNGGETLTLNTFAGTQILALTYNDTTPWPAAADGNGFTAVPVGTVYNSDNGLNWRASASMNGSPRADDPAASFPGIVINEVLANSGPGQKDTIELHNPTAAAASVGDWWLTDDPNVPKKYRIPAGTTIPAGGFATFNEDQFNVGVNAFALNSAGDDVYVFSGNAAGNLTGYSHGVDFGGVELNRSLGRYINSVGEEQYTRQISNTFGAANSGPLVGPLVISEIMYNPYTGYDEYVEIRNISANPVSLFDPANPANRWRVSGITYTFPAGQTIAAGGAALVVNIDPAAFRTKYGIPGSVAIYGPYTGSLQDGGELLALEMPDTPVLDGQGLTVIPYDIIDAVRYNDKAPWPIAADGSGPSLQRLTASAYGNDPINWFADGVTPGATNSTNAVPTVSLTAPANGETFNLPATIALTASATDSDGSVLKVEYYVDGIKVGESSTGPTYSVNWAATAGVHVVTAKALDNSLGAATSTGRTIYVTQAVSQGLKAQYFGNNSLSGVPAGTRVEGPISFSNSVNSWPTALGFPGVGADQFSVRWTGQIRATTTGSYIFRTISDEGVRLYVNGSTVINNWTPHTSTTNNGAISLTAGQLYDITLEYFDQTGDHAIQLLYIPSGGSLATIPNSVLYPDDAPIIVNQPGALTREHASGVAATFTVLSSGKNLTYQWRKDNVDIPGATASSYTVNYPLLSDAGGYSVLIANSFGFAISSPANLTVTFTDTDGDGMQDSWETANGLNSGSSADAALDTDGDGFNNKSEYLAGTDPRNPQSRPALTITKAAGPGFTLGFTAQPYKTYSIQARESLTSGSWVTIQTYPVSPTLQTITYTDPTTLPTRHYRVVTP